MRTIPQGALDYVMYGDNSSVVSNYLQTQMQSMHRFINPITDKIYNAMQASYDYVNNQIVKSGIMNSLRTQGVAVNNDYFSILKTVHDLSSANVTMQRWVMANPIVKKHYLEQNLDGYSDSYTNVFGKDIGENDYNYRMVMSGVVVDTDEYTGYSMYYDQPYPGDRKISYEEKMTVLATWDHMEQILNSSNIDFTHQTNSQARINK